MNNQHGSLLLSLPHTAKKMMAYPWSKMEPFFRELEAFEITAENVSEWLSAWSRLTELLWESYSRLHVASTVDTGDKKAEEQCLVLK